MVTTITISTKEYIPETGQWLVSADIRHNGNTWSGPHILEGLPEGASEEVLKEAVLRLYFPAEA